MIKISVAAVAVLLLCGCSTTTPAQRMANNQASCDAYGFKAGTDAYANCMMQADLAAKEEDADRRARLGAGLRAVGQSMQQPRRVTCNTRGSVLNSGYGAYGNSTTTCY